MGQELIQGELPANSPRPAETPPEGIIMTDVRPDGSSRRYIYIAMAGELPEEITISESGPTKRVSGMASPVYEEQRYESSPLLSGAPEGIDMPGHAVLPEGAVFSGIPSAPRSPVMGAPRPATPRTVMAAPPQVGQVALAGGMAKPPSAVDQRQPIQMSGAVPQVTAAVPVSTMSIQKAAPSAPVIVQAAQGPVLGGQVNVPNMPAPVQEVKQDLSGNIRLSNAIETMRPVVAAPIADNSDRQVSALGNSRALPLTVQESRKGDTYPVSNPVTPGTPMMAGVGPISGPSAFANNQVPIRGLGQTTPPGTPAPAPAAAGPLSKCPGALELPDGRVIEPWQNVSLQDLCEIVPFLVETLTNLQAQGLAPGQKVPVIGQQPGVLAVPNQGAFGPAGGGNPFGRGGGGGFIGGGGGGPGPAGPQGPMGVGGPPGPGSIVEPPVVKTDGDFTAGPGAFIPVPGTALVFAMGAPGVAKFDLMATLGSSSGVPSTSQSAQIGLRIDGTDYPLTTRLIHTFVGGVGEFMIGQSSTFSLSLGAGSHTVEVLLRGLLPGEFGGAGLGIPATIAAVPAVPLVLTVSHNQ